MTNAKNEAARRRHFAANRVALIAALGMKPEPVPCPPGEEYAATTSEMWGWIAKERGVEVANSIAPRWTGGW